MKKNLLFCLSLLAFNLVKAEDTVSSEATFTPQICTFTYTVQAAHLDDINQLHTRLNKLTHRGANTSVYQSLLVFIKELQEALAAGVNLFVTASAQNEPVAQVLEEAIVEAMITSVEPVAMTPEAAVKSAETITEDISTTDATESSVNTEIAATEEVVNTEIVVIEEEVVNTEVAVTEEIIATEPESTEATPATEVVVLESTEDIISTEPNNEAVSQEASVITFSVSGIVNNAQELKTWNEVKELLILLADNVTSQTLINDEIPTIMNQVYDLLKILSPDAPALESAEQA